MERFADICLQEICLGKDLLLIVVGGDRHIGASSTAYWENELVQVQTCAVPGHKEHLLSEELARRAAAELELTVTLVMGIHYDQLNRAEIAWISRCVTKLVDDYLSQKAESKV